MPGYTASAALTRAAYHTASRLTPLDAAYSVFHLLLHAHHTPRKEHGYRDDADNNDNYDANRIAACNMGLLARRTDKRARLLGKEFHNEFR